MQDSQVRCEGHDFRHSHLHTIALTRARIDPDTRAYLTRRTAEGKTTREARRCLKRIIARQIFRHLQGKPDPDLQPAPVDRT